LVIKNHWPVFTQNPQWLKTEVAGSGTTVQGDEGRTTSVPYNLIPNLPTGNIYIAFFVLICQ
jgi:hypothetical protein